MCLFSIYLFLDARENDVYDIRSMSIPTSLLKIKENEKEKDKYFLIESQLQIMEGR
jgi:hypothetical protein